MINANDYETTEELEAAMENEHNLAELEFVKNRISALTIALKKSEAKLEALRHYQNALQDRVLQYYKSHRISKPIGHQYGKSIDTVVFDDL